MKIIKRVLIFIGIILVASLIINIYVFNYSKKYIVNESDMEYILVLGASVNGNSPSLMLKERLDMAIKLYNNNKIIVSGDNRYDDYSEVTVMRNYLLDEIPEDNIICDNIGLSTYDSVSHLKNIYGIDKVVIVTQKYHLYRSIYIARKLGIDAYGVSATKVRYNGQELRDIREYLAIVKDFFKVMLGRLI